MCPSTNRIEIPLEDGIILVAEQNTDPNYPRELYVGMKKMVFGFRISLL